MQQVIQLCLLTLSLWGTAALAQESGESAGTNAPYEFGFHLGHLLPHQIGGVSEIMGLGGIRGGMRMSSGSYLETGLILGNGEGVEWKNLHVDLRMDIPVENLVGIAYIGADSYLYRGVNKGESLIFGGHAGGGVMAQLTGGAWFRGDMKFSMSPGTSLYIGFGFVFPIGGGGAGDAG